MSFRIAVLGAGAWGTAIARHAAQAHPLLLWARDPALAAAIERDRRNERYLPGVELGESLRPASDLAATIGWLRAAPHRLLVLATSIAGLRPTLQRLAALDVDGGLFGAASPTSSSIGFVWLCKGIERGTDLLPHEVVAQVLPHARAGALSGPSFAQEVAAGLPVALTVATTDAPLGQSTVRAFHLGAARIYRSDDLLGVELGGALKNVVAVATGICDGLRLGGNARAALVTRGLAEMSRLGVAMGARAETFMGLTGLGDLVLTCTGDLSRNRRVGLELAAGRSLDQVLASLGHVAEGVACVSAAQALGRRHGVDLPIVDAVAAVLSGQWSPAEAVRGLLAREPKREH
jgi:glycerol-3-phosphate dehydrogenase (NAD(P)+)